MSNMEDDDVRSNDSSFDEADDQDWADWVDDDDQGQGHNGGKSQMHMATSSSGLYGQSSGSRVTYAALFRDGEDLKVFKTAKEALEHSKTLGCDIAELISRLNLDALQVIRLFNHLRRKATQGAGLDVQHVNGLTGTEDFLHSDEELKPVVGYENDGMLQIDFDDLDAELGVSDTADASDRRRIAELESQLQAASLTISDMQARLAEHIGINGTANDEGSDVEVDRRSGKGKGKGRKVGDAMTGEDAHYFSSYASHDIHQVMISDKVRTLSYAKFLLAPENAHLIRGKIVMDVGCGSGILSMFAARAGAKEVVAIDASAVASRAKENVRLNRLDGIITVHHGRVEELEEELSAYVGRVDLIVSEWMGYFLLYESMMPAVLFARDRFLRKPGGLLAPSHTRMLLAAVADCDVINERLGFWDSVHGFTMAAMKTGLVDEAWTDMLKAEQVVTSTETMLELPLHTIAPHQPSFSAPFALRVQRKSTIQAFVSWFDTWFTPDGKPVPTRAKDDDDESESDDGSEEHFDGQIEAGKTLEGLPTVETRCPDESEVRGIDLTRDTIVPKVEKSSSNGLTVSFTTSPFGPETHWKQTLFVLKEPVDVNEGDLLVGILRSSPNEENVRELDVEIHYSVRPPTQPSQVRRKSVEARTVQLFAVR